jgi:anaerobic selenocysteine-containing dehydrogenase
MKTHTICRLCSACCPVEVETENGKWVKAVRKYRFPDEPHLRCPKLEKAADILYAPDRLARPLIKKPDGAFREASWDEALDTVARQFLRCKKEYGAQSVAWLRGMAADWGAPWDYANRLMNAFGSPNCIGNGSVCFVGRDLAHTTVYGTMTLPDTANARCILIWGKNDLDSAPGAAENIRHARRNGAKLIVVDPVKTPFAEMADIWLQIKPAHDGLLAMAMIAEIIAQDLCDTAFVDRWTVGFDDLRAVARHYSAESAALELGLPPERVREAARLYATLRPACIVDGNGLDMQVQSFEATRAVAMLRALTGNLDIPGGDILPQKVPSRNMQLLERLPAEVKPVTADYALFNTYHATWGRQVQSCVIDAILEEKPYPVKTLLVQSGNPLVTFMDARRVRKALEKLEFLAVIDLFLTQTARMADVVLPAGSSFEHTQLNRAFIRSSPVRLQQQVIPAVGESRPNWQIVFDLARRIGLEKEFPWQTAEEAIDEQLAPAGITCAMLRDAPDGILAEPIRCRKYEEGGFATASGKIEFFSAPLQAHGHDPVPYFSGPPDGAISFSDQKERYPLIGISGARSNRLVNSQFARIAALGQNESGCAVDVHPQDAGKYGIAPGDRVRIETPKGAVCMTAKISEVIAPGVIRIAWGWGEVSADYNFNVLTDDARRNPVTGAPSGRAFRCRLKKIGAEQPGGK